MASRIVNGRRFPSKRNWKDEVGLKPLKAPKSSPNSPLLLLMTSPFFRKRNGWGLFVRAWVEWLPVVPSPGRSPVGRLGQRRTPKRASAARSATPTTPPRKREKEKQGFRKRTGKRKKKTDEPTAKLWTKPAGKNAVVFRKEKKNYTSACLRESEAMKHFIKGKLVPNRISCLSEHSFYFV